MHSARNRLTYPNVMSTIAVFIALGGATAFAATALPKNSVGSRQLKKNAVTATKIEAGAVSGNRLADGAVSSDQLAGGAVTGAKIADGGVTADKLAPALPFAQVTQRVTGSRSLAFPSTGILVPYPLDNPTFKQAAGEDDLFVGSITARFPASCKSPRTFEAYLQVDKEHTGLSPTENVGLASIFDDTEGEATRTAQFGARERAAAFIAALPSPTTHTFSIELTRSSCGSGSPPGTVATATGAQIDVIGIR